MLILLKFALFWQGGFFTGGYEWQECIKRKIIKKILIHVKGVYSYFRVEFPHYLSIIFLKLNEVITTSWAFLLFLDFFFKLCQLVPSHLY